MSKIRRNDEQVRKIDSKIAIKKYIQMDRHIQQIFKKKTDRQKSIQEKKLKRLKGEKMDKCSLSKHVKGWKM